MADFDDHLMEELLEGVEPPLEEIERDLCTECSHDQVVPVLVAAGRFRRGRRGARARDRKMVPVARRSAAYATRRGARSHPMPSAPVVARIIKTSIHPQSGKLSIARILCGTIKADATLTNISKGDEKVRLGGLYRLQGKKQEPIPEAGPGTIVALARLDSVATGDTLTSNGHKSALAARSGRGAGLRRRDQAEGAHRRSEDFADAHAHRRRRPGAAARARRGDARAAPARAAASSTSPSRSNGWRENIKSRSKRPPRRFRIRRRSPGGPRSIRVTSTRRAATDSSATFGCASSRASAARALRSRRRSSAASCRGSSFRPSRRACAKRWPAARAAIRSPTCT